MPLQRDTLLQLEDKAKQLRHLIVDTVYYAGSGHLGGALSMLDAIVVLYYNEMNIDCNNPNWDMRDRFVLSKGHAGIGYVCVLSDIGYIEQEELKTFNLTGSKLGIHLDADKAPGVDASTGSLGHGLSMALGMALAAKLNKKSYTTYCMLGDGECNEGSVWEAAMSIANFNAHNLITFVDRNHAMIDGNTEDVMKLEPFADKWRAFGFFTDVINGHDMQAIHQAVKAAKSRTDQPTCIILDTVKGEGVSFAAGDYKWHYGAINDKLRQQAHDSIEEHYQVRIKGV